MNETGELDAMAQMPNELDDLDNLFEFGDIDLNNIPDPDGFGGQMQHSHPGTHPNTPFQDMSQPPPMSSTSAHDYGGHEQFGMSQGISQQQQQQFMAHSDPHGQASMPYTTEGMYQPSMQQVYQSHAQAYTMHSQHGFPTTQQIVPPTPNSFEMQGVSGRFMEQHQQLDAQQRALLAQRFALRKEEIAFTPMVSPAGTPQYNMLPEFTAPGAYFSPLTSPMLHAQNQQQQHQHLQHQHQQQGYITNPSTAPSSNTNSPIDPSLDVDMGDGRTHPASTGPQPRKSGRRKIATAKGAGGAGGKMSESMSQKAQKRKSSAQLQNQHTPQGDDLSLRAVRSQPVSAGLQMPSQFDSSEAESISPEPLSESLMRPPPRPSSSLTHSPALAGQQQHQQQQQQQQRAGANAVAAAATPKSLLTMRSAHTVNGQPNSTDSLSGAQDDLGGLDDLALPEATINPHARKPSLSQIDTRLSMPGLDDENDTPRMSARKTPKLGPLSTPASASARPGSAMQSPVPASPMTASTPSAILRDRKDGKGGRGSGGGKKRGSMSANGSKMVSPALVPKISPSIKPLLPEGTPLNTATQAMLLASKSNYQNLLEGNRLPGVSYPDSLSTGLTSKRTSHKVAEQGRRNRINEALREMQALIPRSTPVVGAAKSPSGNTGSGVGEGDGSPDGVGEEGDAAGVNGGAEGGKESKEELAAKNGNGNSNSNSSKAATVELANEYIKRMQRDQASQVERIARLEREKEDLERRLAGNAEAGEVSE